MMDLHILIVISCVVLASLCSLLFINKFFRRKTFEEIIAEKKALNERIYQSKALANPAKKPKKLQQLKKELKRERKQRQKEQARDTTEQEDSDAQSEQPSVEEEPEGLSKTHVEFEPDPEVVTYSSDAPSPVAGSSSLSDKESVSAAGKHKSKKEKKSGKATAGILLNKNEPVAVKETAIVEELNTFEVKVPKDSIELKKQEKEKEKEKDKKEDKAPKKEKAAAKKREEKHAADKSIPIAAEQPVVELVVAPVAKELKQLEEKVRQGSPKNQQHNNNKAKQQSKKQSKETAASKELVLALDKLSETDTIGVSLLMNLFRHAELNRSEIQILIDYLLNKQQDMPSSHSEWSDDICQKLKRQLEEKERALAEEQEASIGIQAKLRDLRTEINTERAQMNATIKAYMEKIQAKEQELAGLNQEVQALNDKITLERQQFQAKLLREKQAGSQDLLAQLQLMQNELAHKDKVIGELTCMVNASRQAVDETQQKSEIIQNQAQQIRALEQQREELEQISNNRIFELEKAKTIETENAEIKVELRNLQNAIESAKADLVQARQDNEAAKSELTLVRNVELNEKQQDIQLLQTKNAELAQQLAGYSNEAAAQNEAQSSLQVTLDAIKKQLADKEAQLAEFNAKHAELLQQVANAQANTQQQTQQQQELQKLVGALQADAASKQAQLEQVQQSAENQSSREQELLQQLQEQKEKNNDLRMKNWKLIEALQIAETTNKQNKTLSSANANLVQQQQLLAASTAKTHTDSSKEQQQIRELFQRLYPEAVKLCASSALSAPFDQWLEQVLAAHVQQAAAAVKAPATSSSSKATQSQLQTNNATSSNHNNSTHNSTHSNNNNNNNLSNSEATNNSNSRLSNNNKSSSSTSSSSSSSQSESADMQKVCTENAQLRVQIDELTKLVTKTSNTLLDLEKRAREQDENWRSIVRSKEEQILVLQQHSNGDPASEKISL